MVKEIWLESHPDGGIRQYVWRCDASIMRDELQEWTQSIPIKSPEILWKLVDAWIEENNVFVGATILHVPPKEPDLDPVWHQIDMARHIIVGNTETPHWYQLDVSVDEESNVYISIH